MLPSRCAVRPLGRATVLCCCAALAESVAFDSVGREFDRKDDTIMFREDFYGAGLWLQTSAREDGTKAVAV